MTPPELVVVSNGVLGTAAAPLVEGSQAGRIYPPNGSVLSLVVYGSNGKLAMHIRSLKITLLILLILLVLYIHMWHMRVI